VKLTTSWRKLPAEVRRHLDGRLSDRGITEGDLYKMAFWLEGQPDVPEEEWFRDFGTFKLAGRGPLVLTFLTADQTGYGIKIKD
jgi:hypothetical protein